jgi:dolichyl-phosphate-mannose-protein mannosyltransferase
MKNNEGDKNRLRKKLELIFVNDRKIIDVLFVVFCISLTVYYYFLVSAIQLPIWDGGVFLANAKGWLNGTPLPETFRPPLLSWLISAVWAVTGENLVVVKYIPAAFSISSGIILYLILSKNKRSVFSLSVSLLTMLNPLVLFWGEQIMAESISLFFLVMTLYFLKSEKTSHWFFAGIAIGLTFASRYPIIIPALALFAVESLIIRRLKFTAMTILGILPVASSVILAIYLKTGAIGFAMQKDTNFTVFLSPFYLYNWPDIWGLSFLFIPLGLLFRRTYADRFNYAFIAWFAISLIFWSANSTNQQERFAFHIMPAVYYLAMLGIENLSKKLNAGIPSLKIN